MPCLFYRCSAAEVQPRAIIELTWVARDFRAAIEAPPAQLLSRAPQWQPRSPSAGRCSGRTVLAGESLPRVQWGGLRWLSRYLSCASRRRQLEQADRTIMPLHVPRSPKQDMASAAGTPYVNLETYAGEILAFRPPAAPGWSHRGRLSVSSRRLNPSADARAPADPVRSQHGDRGLTASARLLRVSVTRARRADAPEGRVSPARVRSPGSRVPRLRPWAPHHPQLPTSPEQLRLGGEKPSLDAWARVMAGA